ncbi:hypothetical protein ACFVVM_32170 [Nocardia sp. NPDC058176]|uniref:hypothetical protein n=1 Tax=Nocardia sp. NPDC058176 TaxID=3346368 RepID=UPI0036DC725B
MYPAQPHHPPAVPVAITASDGIALKYRRAMMMAEFAPGFVVELRTGVNQFQLAPGHYRVQLWSQYALWRVGHATLDIDTTRGPVHFHYASPHTLYSSGAAGFTPQERPGKNIQFLVFAVALLVPLLVVLAALVL